MNYVLLVCGTDEDAALWRSRPIPPSALIEQRLSGPAP